LSAKGYLMEDLDDSVPGRTLGGIAVPEDIDGIRVYHVLPIILDEGTAIRTRRGVSLSRAELLYRVGAASTPYVTARLTLGPRALFADLLGIDEATTAPTPEYLVVPGGGATHGKDVAGQSRDASGTPWLSIPPSGRPSTVPLELHGYDSWSMEISEPNGTFGVADLGMYDSIRGAGIVHIARVYFASEAEYAAFRRRADALPPGAEFTIGVRRRGNLLLTAVR
jgi:hypothetical protein